VMMEDEKCILEGENERIFVLSSSFFTHVKLVSGNNFAVECHQLADPFGFTSR